LAGIYLHIPFCKQACHYCNFHFVTSTRHKNELLAALLKETVLQAKYLEGSPVETVYFGGGTPSLLETGELSALLHAVRQAYQLSAGAEITLEANPDDITEEKLLTWKEIGITRLSIGIQSFFEEDLRWMNRAHNAAQAINALQLATRHFDNITIDLIYGTPGLTDEKWKSNVDKAISLGIPHLSCYALTVEPKTPLHKMIRQGISADTNPDKQSEQFLLLMDWLKIAGYEHYEISNFALPGFRSRHNSSYWQGKKYLGLGPSAHSFDGSSRQWNIANNAVYIDSLAKGIIPFEKEVLTASQRANEYIMTSLRTSEGMNLDRLGDEEKEKVLADARKYLEHGSMKKEGNFLVLTNEGRLIADGIAASLFIS
jgi:oxygen-independent coproporphyrinogen-3 oxidase